MEFNKRYYHNLTHPQKRIWYIDKVNLNSPLHNIGGSLKINESIDIDKLKETINITVKENEGLRLRFTEKDGQPVQYVHDFEKENIDFLDFSSYEMPRAEHQKWSESLFKRSFELEDNKLYYFAIYKISEKEYGVILSIHHIISDGWSISLIQKQICEIYSKLVKNETMTFDESCSYVDFIKEENEYFNSDKFTKNKNFWNGKFNSLTEEFLYKTSNSLEGKRKSFNIDSGMSREIKRFVEDKKCSLNTFFIAILLTYINKTTYKNDLVIGTPVFNRVGKKQKGMVGMFTSTVPFRFTLDTELHIENLIKLINRELKLCFLNQKYPYDLLIKDLELSKKGYDSLFKMSVNYYNTKYVKDIDGVDVEVQEYYSGNQSYSLQLTVKEWEDNNITLNFDYKTSEYREEEIQIMHNSMINVIKEILTTENPQVKDIKLLSVKEINHKIYTINSTKITYPNKTVCELFEEQAIKTPDKVALEFKEERLTYRELNDKSNQLANYLSGNGVKKESIVGIMVSHSIELVVGILGVLKAGGAYLPIDPSYPIERINYMLQDSESLMLLTNFEVDDEVKFRVNITNINDVDLNLYSKENSRKINGLNDLVYIIYTSGSTGKPKGVMIEHRGLINYIWWAKKMYLKDEKGVMALYSSISFDLTVTSIFTPLISGNQIVIYDTDETEFVLYKILRENKATVVKLTPAHLTLLKDMDNSNSNIKRFIVGGEDLKVSLAKEIYNSFAKDIEIYNEYGPTETVVGCMIYKYNEENDKGVSVPIGYPADNVQVYILDNDFNVAPTGIVGELYVSGDGVSRGYLNREELTYERFIENPFIKGKKMYKTGDTARYLENGVMEYVGRIDNQVKIRGHRIELGEIEKYLLKNEAIKDAVVAFKEESIGNNLLNAYIVSKKSVTDLELKSWLLKFLPKYMIPSNFIHLEQLPLTVNGKVNYNLLPDPILVENEFVKSKTDVEKELVKAMEEILGVENISMKDNYYQLGGDSIKAIQISSKLKNVGLEIKVKDILNHDFIGEIAATVEFNKSSRAISQEKCMGDIHSTPIIEWFFNQRFLKENSYNQYILLECNETLDINKVTIAVNKLVEHHDSLRINYNKELSKLYYNNQHLNEPYHMQYFDLSECSYDEQRKEIKKISDELKIKFHMENSLLFNLTMFKLGDDRQVLLFTAHHLIVDGVSWRIILNDFVTILNQLDNNEDINLPMKTHSFKEWSEQLQDYRGNDFEVEKVYWNSILDKNFNYPADFNGKKDIVKTSVVLSDELDEDTTNGLIKKVNEIYNIELNEVLIIALALTISKTTNNEDIVIELERHGRESLNDYIDISRTVGWFTSIYPAYFKIDHEEIDSNIKSIKEQLRTIPNKGFNYSILKFLNHELKEADNKYVRFNYLGDFDNIIREESLNIANIKFGLSSGEENSLTALMDIEAMIVNKKLKISITYSNNRFENGTIQRFIDQYIETLKLILDHCVNKVLKEFTSSDFDAVDISQEDLDNLFD
ncbi:amino acid adenylation domain-containing protein [Clostridium tagluense]|uniref:non-ribosomal peptide synthetase n=1 Tax=Clostridium tagluense TaxID=360422 RepID=UPI001CF50986|nr:non-ribosomal peptide synthetase [Clostridium tagluense]MCB2311589.1 amino acid adenylation domain-containing protein [Clostridium tagluense]MCB2316313.1 amino acid adenylation domain-containing protein [Clostridium tagluense]MCB2321168.1 amino acid adenylation domain-containing protein [Clostridium tagluense]MCB2326182.1 amino acid adenylation domain-containing protein [Clostridium tagluense]MCB2330905.1 amino acid adenylation domain-containing protein [Clostridium tagluense]